MTMYQAPDIDPTPLTQIRLLAGDNRPPMYWTDDEVAEFYRMENNDVEQAAALLLESWASRISYEEGAVTSGGLSINGPAMAADKRQRAMELRIRMVRG